LGDGEKLQRRIGLSPPRGVLKSGSFTKKDRQRERDRKKSVTSRGIKNKSKSERSVVTTTSKGIKDNKDKEVRDGPPSDNEETDLAPQLSLSSSGSKDKVHSKDGKEQSGERESMDNKHGHGASIKVGDDREDTHQDIKTSTKKDKFPEKKRGFEAPIGVISHARSRSRDDCRSRSHNKDHDRSSSKSREDRSKSRERSRAKAQAIERARSKTLDRTRGKSIEKTRSKSRENKLLSTAPAVSGAPSSAHTNASRGLKKSSRSHVSEAKSVGSRRWDAAHRSHISEAHQDTHNHQNEQHQEQHHQNQHHPETIKHHVDKGDGKKRGGGMKSMMGKL